MTEQLKQIALTLGGTNVDNPIGYNQSGSVYSVGTFLTNTMLVLVFPFAFLIAIILIAIGGLRIIMSQGNPGAVAGGRSMIINSVIGLVILCVAWAVTAYISSSLLNVNVVG